MKSWSKWLGALLTCALALTLCLLLHPVQANAITDGYYTYTYSGGKITITDVKTSISGDVVIPSTLSDYPVTEIGYNAFSGCTKMTSVTIPESVTSIGSSAFEGCSGLTRVYVADLVSWCNIQFSYHYANPMYYADTLYIDGIPLAGEIEIPAGTTNLDYTFMNCTDLTTVTIPESVTGIGKYAFYNCTGLTVINLPDTVTNIGDDAFYNCIGLTSITIPDSVTGIGFNSFKGCTGLRSATIGNGVTYIGYGAFENCTRLSSARIGNSVTSIGSQAFYNCESLTSLTIPESVTSLGRDTFSGCYGLKAIQFNAVNMDDGNPNSINNYSVFAGAGKNSGSIKLTIGAKVQEIPGKIFSGYITSVEFEEVSECKTIRAFAFSSLYELKSITIPKSVTSIGLSAFNSDLVDLYYAGDLQSWLSISFPAYSSPVRYVENIYLDGKLLSGAIVIPEGVKSIPIVFNGRRELTSVVIPDSVTSICMYAFEDCTNLTNVVIGESVVSIGKNAFNNSGLSTVFYKGTQEQWESIGIGENNTPLTDATHHYVVETACVHDYLYCADCDSSFDLTGTLIPAYLVQFKNWDGSIHSGVKYHHGDIVAEPEMPTKAADKTYTYTFTGWDREVAICSGEAVYTATYTPVYIDYTVTFKDWDGTVLSEKTYHYGDTVGVPADPTRAADNTYTYAFNSWDQEIIACAGDTVYTATYTPTYIEYTVIFKDWDSTVLSEKTYHYGDVVEIPADPTKAADNTYSYPFAGWDADVSTVSGDATYTATYTPTYIDYTVTFKDWDGTVLSEKTYHYGDAVEVPADPTRAADNTYTYAFNSWDQEVIACAGDTVYTATYTPTYIEYTVIFKDWDSTVLSEKTYHYGDTIIAPETPTKAADNTYTYPFAGWDKPLVCAGDDVITATYTPTYIDYTVIFKDEDGAVISQKTYHYGDAVEIPTAPTKAADNTYTYTFAGWDTEVSAVSGDATYTATYTPTYIDYTVTFKDWDGFTIEKKTYHYGDTVTVPADPIKAGDRVYTYTFTGWDPQITVCTADTVYTATYSREMIDYVVTFQNADGTVISQKTYHYGDSVEIPTDFSAPEGYRFASWDKEIVTTVDGNAVYTAIYELDWLKGDFDSSGSVDDADALYLLRHTLFADRYPIPGDGDVDGNGSVDDADALYLLRHTLFSDRYPLYPTKEEI